MSFYYEQNKTIEKQIETKEIEIQDFKEIDKRAKKLARYFELEDDDDNLSYVKKLIRDVEMQSGIIFDKEQTNNDEYYDEYLLTVQNTCKFHLDRLQRILDKLKSKQQRKQMAIDSQRPFQDPKPSWYARFLPSARNRLKSSAITSEDEQDNLRVPVEKGDENTGEAALGGSRRLKSKRRKSKRRKSLKRKSTKRVRKY